jgi:hypothetical protein
MDIVRVRRSSLRAGLEFLNVSDVNSTVLNSANELSLWFSDCC